MYGRGVLGIVLLAALVGPAPAAADGSGPTQIEFGSPATFDGAATAVGEGWALFVIGNNASLALDVEVPDGTVYTEHHRLQMHAWSEEASAGPIPVRDTAESSDVGPGVMRLTFAGSYLATLLVVGEVEISHADARNIGLATGSGYCFNDSHEITTQLMYRLRTGAPCLGVPGVLWKDGVDADPPPVTVMVHNLTRLEWHAGNTACSGLDPCPGGAMPSEREAAVPGVAGAMVIDTPFSELTMPGGSAAGQGVGTEAFLQSAGLDLSFDGFAELPSATVPECTGESCPKAGQTIQAEGSLLLSGMTGDGEGNRLSAQVSGRPTWLRLDETYVDPSVLFGPTAAAVTTTAAAVATALLYKLVAPLFTRMTGDQALEHPRRRLLYGFITDHPGTTFRELLRGTDVPAGTARHHLTIMTRTGLIVERRHKSTLRFFENHGRFDATWDAVVLLREPELAELHAWLKDHPACMQKDILTGMQGRGWQRSTTQHRLNRLVDGGLVTVRPQGRVKLYTAHEEVQQPVPEEAWLGSGSFRQGVVGPIARP